MVKRSNILTVDTMEKLFEIKFCNFFHSNYCKNIVSLAVVRLLLGRKNILDNGETVNIFSGAIIKKIYKI